MKDLEKQLVNKLLKDIVDARSDNELDNTIRRYGDFIRAVAVRMDAETRSEESKQRIAKGRL